MINTAYAITGCPNYYGVPDGGVFAKIEDCYTNVTSGKYITSFPLAFEAGANGTGTFGYSSYNGSSNSGNNLATNTWFVDFSYGRLYGDAVCKNGASWGQSTNDQYDKDSQDGVNSCWCRLNSVYDLNASDQYISKWVGRGPVNSNDCWKDCAYECARVVGNLDGWGDTVRRALFGYPIQETCPVGSYCSGGNKQYGDSGANLCPVGFTSDAGASSITECYVDLPAGKAVDSNYLIIDCPIGKYCSQANRVYYNITNVDNLKTSCPDGYTTDAGASSKTDCYINVSAGNYATAGFTEELLIEKQHYQQWHKSEFATYPDNWNVENNSWAYVLFNNTAEDLDRIYLYGRSACSNLSYGLYSHSTIPFNSYTADGNYCWCKMNTPTNSEWVQVYADYGTKTEGYNSATDCWFNCAGSCAYQMEKSLQLRNVIQSYSDKITQICPENFYCEGGKYYFGTPTVLTKCPTGTTSPAGSASINQCVSSTATITYNTNGGSGCDNDTYTPGTTKELCTPTYAGHTFLGWYTAATGGTLVSSITASDTGDKELFAQWIANTINIVWNNTLQTEIDANNAGQCIYGGNINTPRSVVRIPGKHFDGWKFVIE